MPWKWIVDIPTYDFLTASSKVAAVAVAAITRPPDALSWLLRSVVPAWKIVVSGPGVARVISCPLAYDPGYPSAAATTVAANLGLVFIVTPSSQCSVQATITSARSVSSVRRGRRVCVSGSPPLTLYSRTFGPLPVIIIPVKSMPTNGNPTDMLSRSDTLVRVSDDHTFLSHSVYSGLHNRPIYLFQHLLWCDSSRGVAAHSSRVWALISVEDSFMVLRWRKRPYCVSIRECQDTQLISFKKFLNDNLITRFSKLAVDHHLPKCLMSFLFGLGNDDTLSGRKTTSFDNYIVLNRLKVSAGRFTVAEILIFGSWNAVTFHEILRKCLGTFHTGCRF